MIQEVSIEIIKKCPNRCLHCSSSSTLESTEIMPLPLMKSVLLGLHALGVKKVSLSGGEPFLHTDLHEIVYYAVNNGMEVNIYTCGVTLKGDGLASLGKAELQALKDLGVSRLMFNLQAMDEKLFDEISGTKGRYPLVLQSIKNAVAAQLTCEIHFVPMQCNRDEIAEIIRFAEREGMDQVSFLKLVPHGRAKENLERILLNESEDTRVQQELYAEKARGAKIRIGLPYSEDKGCAACHAVSEKLYIRYDGCVFGCEAFKFVNFTDGKGKRISPDSIFKTSIEEIASHSEHLESSKRLVAHYHCVQTKGESCPVQKYLIEMGLK